MLDSGFGENFGGAKIIVRLYFGGSGDWIILRRRCVATEVARTSLLYVARTTLFAARAFAFVATEFARTSMLVSSTAWFASGALVRIATEVARTIIFYIARNGI